MCPDVIHFIRREYTKETDLQRGVAGLPCLRLQNPLKAMRKMEDSEIQEKVTSCRISFNSI